MKAGRIGIAGLASLAMLGCWPFGGGKPKTDAPPQPLSNSPRTIDSLWLAGQRAFNRGKWNQATEIFTRLSTAMPVTDPRLSRLTFYQGEIQMGLGNELDAVRQFRRVADETPDDSLAPAALLRAADAYAQLWKRPELDPTYGQTALSVYQEVASRYPNTGPARQAEVRVAQLNDQFARKEYLSALFYYKYKAYESAILMLRSLVVQYPRAKVVPDALEKLVLSYRALGYEEDLKETCDYISRFHGASTTSRRHCPAAAAATADSIGSP